MSEFTQYSAILLPATCSMSVPVSVQEAAVDRRTVSASYDVDGYHRDRRFMAVLLGSTWKLENIVEASSASLRRALRCNR